MTMPPGGAARRAGMVLLSVLFIIAMMAMVSASVMFRMHAEASAATAGRSADQAYMAAMSGIRRAVAVVSADRLNRDAWWDDEDLFKDQFVWDAGGERWYFTVYAHNPDDPNSVRYGVADEAGRIHLNVADAETLAGLPNMTPERVDCLLDYIDADEEPRNSGAEQEAYDYGIKNGPLDTLEELLLVRGFHGGIVFGEDANRNGLLEANEDDGEDRSPADDANGELDLGIAGMATVISGEPDVDSRGRRRVNVNSGSAALRRAGLSNETVEFITLYLDGQEDNPPLKHPSELLEKRFQLRVDHDRRRAGQWVESGVGGGQLATVLDRLTVGSPAAPPAEGEWDEAPEVPSRRLGRSRAIAGLVNVNTASAAVLAALPPISSALAEEIVATRRELMDRAYEELDEDGRPTTVMQTPAWLYTEGVVSDPEMFKQIAPLLTARSYQFRVRCIGYGVPSGRFRVLEAVLDLTGKQPRIVYLRDITRLGLPFALLREDEEPR